MASAAMGSAPRTDRTRHDAPHHNASLGGQAILGIARVREGEDHAGAELGPDLEGALAVHVDHHHVAGLWLEAPVDHGEVAVVKLLADHAVALDADQEGGGAVADQEMGEVDLLLEEVVGRGWKA